MSPCKISNYSIILIVLLFISLSSCQQKQQEVKQPSWPGEVKTVHITSTMDGSHQPALFWTPCDCPPGATEPMPLLVALHSWSFGYEQPNMDYFTECKKRGWVFIHPHFRGPNWTSDACGSPLAVQDILDAVAFAKSQTNVDPERIYLTGGSGGGYASLLLAGKSPQIWAGVSSWVPISDLAAWHKESSNREEKYKKYALDMEKVCGGEPGVSPEIDEQYKNRSALTYLTNAKGLPVDLNAGIHDGHIGPVPLSHTLRAFNLLAEVNGFPDKKLMDVQIKTFVEKEMVPAELLSEKVNDDSYPKQVLFRRTAGPVRVTIFEGGHDILMGTAIAWLEKRKKGNK